MKALSRCLALSTVILLAAALASIALARGGRGGIGGGGFASLCTSTSFLDLTLSNIDNLIKTTGDQTTALEELKKVAKENSENMSGVCSGGNSPMSFTAKLTAAEKRLDVALAGDRKLERVAEIFYATLNDKQKDQVNNLVFWPGQ